ncbi:hypothetical protein AaE_004028, partial [Aphanomyces astaci]
MLLYPPYIIMSNSGNENVSGTHFEIRCFSVSPLHRRVIAGFCAREVVVMSKFPVPQDFIYCPPLGKDERANLVNLGENSLIDLVRSSKLHSGAIKWTMDSDENGIQIFHGEDPNGPTEVTLLAGVTEVLATFDEIAALFRQETKEAYAEYTKLFAKDTLDSAHLYTISTATPDRPRHFMGVRWVVIGSPYPLLANRDLCYLECQDDFEINGKRGWGRSMTSISLPCCPDFEGHLGTIRATFIRSGFVVHESKRPGYLQVIHALQIDLKGRVPQWVVKIGMKKRARSIGDFDKYLREKRLSAKPYLRDQDLVPKSSRFKCFLCQSKFGTFSTKVRCRKCGEVVCGKCNKFWQVKTTNAGRKMIRVCSACSITGGGHDGYPKDGVASSVAVSGVASSSEYSDERSDTSAQDSMQQETISLSGSEPQGSSGGPNYYPPAMDRARHQQYQQQHLAPSRGYPAHHGQYSHQGASQLPTVSPQWGPRNNLPIHNRTQQRNSLTRYDDHQPLPTSSSQPPPQPPLSPYSLSIRLHKDGDDDITSSPGGGSQSPHAAHGAARSTPRVDDSNGSNTSPMIHDARDMYIMGATADDGEFDSATNPRGPPQQQPLQAQGEYSHGSKPADERHEDDNDNDDRLFITRESDDDNDAMSAYSEYSHAAPPLAKLVYPSRHINPLGAVYHHRSPRQILEIDPYAAKPFLHGPSSLQPQHGRGGLAGRHGPPPTHVAKYSNQLWAPNNQLLQGQQVPTQRRRYDEQPINAGMHDHDGAHVYRRRGGVDDLRGYIGDNGSTDYGADPFPPPPPRGMEGRRIYPYDSRDPRDHLPRDYSVEGSDFPVNPRHLRMAARDPRGVDPRGRPYDSRDFDHRRDFADDEHGEIP